MLDWRSTHERTGCALVTGGSRGIGAATAHALAGTAGPSPSTTARARTRPSSRRTNGRPRVAVQADVADPAPPDTLFAAAEEAFGVPVLVLVNNAGVTADNLSPVARPTTSGTRVVATNLTGAFRLTRRALRPMLRARFGRIVNVASVVGQRANPGQANYAAAKAGLIGLTKTVAAEVARRGVTVNAVAPGFIATDMTAGLDGATMLEHDPRPPRRHPRGGRRLRRASSPPPTPPTSPEPP